MMQTALYTTDIDTLIYWQKELKTESLLIESDEELLEQSAEHPDTIILADYDTVAARDADGHHHRFVKGRSAVVHGCIGRFHGSQAADS